MAAWVHNLLAACVVSVILFPNLAPAAVVVQVIDLSFPNKTQHSFTVAWGYRLDGGSSSDGDALIPEGFRLTVDNVYEIQLLEFDLDGNETSYRVEDVDSGTAFYACVTPTIADVPGNGTACDFVRTVYDPWNERAELACYIGVGILVILVVLVTYDFLYPRMPAGDHQQPKDMKRPKREKPKNATSSTIELNDNLY